ncbi:type II toxin-antitoxin system Phd/YefM family antitoxin [Cellulosimicrobium sp. E-16]|uniref:type II toxin-antitoxin system Phd/YefM family antitoxin n=1 Tax=Cellulosimicrobium sp. E-16 TaxID=3404049 RepID=UPI003CF3CA5E
MQVNVLEAKNNLSQLVNRAAAGEDVVIARRGVPLVRLVPVRADLAHGTGAAIVEWLDDHPHAARSLRTAEQVDAAIEAEREGWE